MTTILATTPLLYTPVPTAEETTVTRNPARLLYELARAGAGEMYAWPVTARLWEVSPALPAPAPALYMRRMPGVTHVFSGGELVGRYVANGAEVWRDCGRVGCIRDGKFFAAQQ